MTRGKIDREGGEKGVEIGLRLIFEIDFEKIKGRRGKNFCFVVSCANNKQAKKFANRAGRCKTGGGRFVAVNTFFPPSKLTGGLQLNRSDQLKRSGID